MVVVITGASAGIGLGIAKELIHNGHSVWSLSRTAPLDTRINHIVCDVTDSQSVDKAFSKLFQNEKQIDVFINNAGIGISGAVEKTKFEDIEKIFAVNFRGAVLCSQYIIPKMREQGSGKILFISSVGSVFTIPFQSFYSATKNAINSLAEGLRLELRPFGIQVGVILPGDIQSSFIKNRKKDLDGEDVYGGRIEKSIGVMERDEVNGMCPDKVGKNIARYLFRKRIKPYKVIGIKYKLFCCLNKILPKSFVLAILYKIYGGN